MATSKSTPKKSSKPASKSSEPASDKSTNAAAGNGEEDSDVLDAAEDGIDEDGDDDDLLIAEQAEAEAKSATKKKGRNSGVVTERELDERQIQLIALG